MTQIHLRACIDERNDQLLLCFSQSVTWLSLNRADAENIARELQRFLERPSSEKPRKPSLRLVDSGKDESWHRCNDD